MQQQTILRRRYPNCEIPDVIDRVWTLFGHIAHSLLEEHGSEGSITEKRFYLNVLGQNVSGQIDHLKDRKITDYKTTGAYKIQKGEFNEWSMQLNLYSFLCEENGWPVDSIRIIAIIRDWSNADYAKNPQSYPKAPIVVLPLVKWSKEVRRKHIEQRVSLLLANEHAKDDRLPPCTAKERWMNFRDWAVFKDDNTKATKVFKDINQEREAIEFAQSKGPNYEVKKRYSPPTRCIGFCNVNSVCHQFKKYLEENANEQEIAES